MSGQISPKVEIEKNGRKMEIYPVELKNYENHGWKKVPAPNTQPNADKVKDDA